MAKPTAKNETANEKKVKKDGAKRVYSRKRKTPNKKGSKINKAVVVEETPAEDTEDVIIEEVVAVDEEEEVVEEDCTENAVTENVVESNEAVDITVSTSKRIDIEPGENEESSSIGIDGFRLVDMSILSIVFKVLSCPGCKATNCITLSESGKQGLSSTLILKCDFCLYEYSFSTSKKCRPQNSTKKKKRNGVVSSMR